MAISKRAIFLTLPFLTYTDPSFAFFQALGCHYTDAPRVAKPDGCQCGDPRATSPRRASTMSRRQLRNRSTAQMYKANAH